MAELVVSLETKVDRIEDYLIDEIYKVAEADLEKEQIVLESMEEEKNSVKGGQERLEEQFHELKGQLNGLENDLDGIKETLQEMKKLISGS